MDSIAYIILKGAIRALGALPLKFHYACGNVMAWLAGSVFHYRRDVVMANISRSFPDKKYHELKQICKDFYRHFGEIVAETIWFAGCTDAKRLRDAHIVEMVNPELFNELYNNTPSLFLLASHAGNWELFGGYVSYAYSTPLDIPENDISVVYKKMSSQVWDRIMKENRISPIVDSIHYDGIVETGEVMRYMVQHRKERKAYCFITDQHPYKGAAGIDVGEFMHQPTTSMDGAAKLAAKFGMSVAYVGMERVSRGHYRLKFTTICENAAETTPEEIMKKYYQMLQEDIEAQPANYLWTHKRWK